MREGVLRETPVKEQEEGKRDWRGRSRSWVQTCRQGAEKGGEEARGREAPGLGQVCGAPGRQDSSEGSQEGQKRSGSGTHCAGLSAGSTPESGL